MEDAHGLRVFLTVAGELSFTRAGEKMFLTQSGVSHQVAKLEASLGTRLLIRQGRNITLTPAGKALQVHARRVFIALEDAESAVRLAASPDAGRLRIGASATACQYIVPEALREFRESFPDFSLHITPGDAPEITQGILDGELDLGIIIRRDRQPKLKYHDLFTDEIGFLLNPLHPSAKKGKVDREQLMDQRMILYSRTSTTFRMIEQYFVRMRVPLRDYIELGSIEAIKELVKLGLGASLTARWIARPEIESGSLVWLHIAGAHMKRVWTIATHIDRELNIAEQTFVGLCKDIGSQIARQSR